MQLIFRGCRCIQLMLELPKGLVILGTGLCKSKIRERGREFCASVKIRKKRTASYLGCLGSFCLQRLLHPYEHLVQAFVIALTDHFCQLLALCRFFKLPTHVCNFLLEILNLSGQKRQFLHRTVDM
eukprot:1840996-Rhodomonas_salina.1